MGRARIHETPGKYRHPDNNFQQVFDMDNDFIHSAMVDETYQHVASHIDSATQMKIVEGDYVDFAKLVSRDRVMAADVNRFEMMMKEGKTYWVPANRDSLAITNYTRWEQAFRV